MQADAKATTTDCRGHLDQLAHEVLESCGLDVQDVPAGADPFDIVADSMFEAVDRGESRQVRRLTMLLDFAILIRRARLIEDPKIIEDMVPLADILAERLLLSGHPASASASGLSYINI